MSHHGCMFNYALSDLAIRDTSCSTTVYASFTCHNIQGNVKIWGCKKNKQSFKGIYIPIPQTFICPSVVERKSWEILILVIRPRDSFNMNKNVINKQEALDWGEAWCLQPGDQVDFLFCNLFNRPMTKPTCSVWKNNTSTWVINHSNVPVVAVVVCCFFFLTYKPHTWTVK